MWHWLLDISLFLVLIVFMVDVLTFCWVKRCYEWVYLLVRTNGWLIFVDVDGLKGINTRHGHIRGNQVLGTIGRILQRTSWARAFRYGGDEFAILLPWTSYKKACQLAEKIRKEIEQANIGVTVTCAVAKYEQKAVELLRQAKAGGQRNMVITAEEPRL